MEKQKFEDKWKEAFGQASVNPSDTVWTNIELDLINTDQSSISRRLFYYKLTAAASIIFALCAGLVGFYQYNDNQSIRLAISEQNGVIERLLAEQEKIKNDIQSTQAPNTGNNTVVSGNDQADALSANKNLYAYVKSEGSTSLPSEQLAAPDRDATTSLMPALDRQLQDFSSRIAEPKLAFKIPEKKTEELDPVQQMMAKLEDRERALAKSEETVKTNVTETLWTSLGIAGGAFNSTGTHISPTASNQAIQFNNTVADEEAKAAGVSYAVGVNMGTRISGRWVVQGGVNYLTQMSDYTAQAAISTPDLQTFRPASINELRRFDTKSAVSENKLITTSPYNVNNSIRYLTIPVQAGYMLVDSRLGLQLNAGVSTDLFLSNVKTAEGNNLDKIEEGTGQDSPYRSTNFSGLLGTELSYRLGGHYRFALNPGIRYPLNSVYKSDIGVKAAPVSFDLGLRFRYIFR